jgi:drug/metabolite transporter (DMT)-like permease
LSVPLRFRFSWPLALAILAWALNYIALKLVYKQFTASQLAFLRYLVMYAALLVICLVSKESLEVPRKDFWRLMFFGFCTMGAYMFFFLEGMRWSTPAEGAILLNTTPILTMILAAVIVKEKLRPGSLVGAIVAFTGIVLVTSQGAVLGQHKMLGYGLLELGALTWAYSIVIMKPLLGRYSPVRLMTLSMPGGFLPMLIYWLYRDHGVMPLASVTPLGWLEFGHVAMLSGVMGFLLFYRGVHEIGPAEAAMWMYFVPPLTAVFQWMFTGTVLSLWQFLGLFVVIAGVATAQHFRAVGEVAVAPAEPA